MGMRNLGDCIVLNPNKSDTHEPYINREHKTESKQNLPPLFAENSHFRFHAVKFLGKNYMHSI
jgi:hypothetical protein